MLQHHLVTCALKMSLFITALQRYRHQLIKCLKKKKKVIIVFHSSNNKDCGLYLFLSVYKACGYLVQWQLYVTQTKMDHTEKINIQIWHNSTLNKASISLCKMSLIQRINLQLGCWKALFVQCPRNLADDKKW